MKSSFWTLAPALIVSVTACHGEDEGAPRVEPGSEPAAEVEAALDHAPVDPSADEIQAMRLELAQLRAENQRLRELLATHAPEALEESDPTVGDRVDHAVEATGHGLRVAGEKTGEGLHTAAEKTGEGLEKAASATGRFLQRMGRKIEGTAEEAAEE